MDSDRVEMNNDGELLEAVLTGNKRHPHLVSTIAWCAILTLELEAMRCCLCLATVRTPTCSALVPGSVGSAAAAASRGCGPSNVLLPT